jgi:hypothetical protein
VPESEEEEEAEDPGLCTFEVLRRLPDLNNAAMTDGAECSNVSVK